MANLNPSKCPLCGKLNLCAMEIAKTTGNPQEPCWCVNATFTPELLAKLPSAAKGQACICAVCASQTTPRLNAKRDEPY